MPLPLPCPLQCLIPEVPFKLMGDSGMFAYLEKVLNDKGHAVVCVAEGAGQVRWLGRGGVRGGEGARRRPGVPRRSGRRWRCRPQCARRAGDGRRAGGCLLLLVAPAASASSIGSAEALPPGAPALGLAGACAPALDPFVAFVGGVASVRTGAGIHTSRI